MKFPLTEVPNVKYTFDMCMFDVAKDGITYTPFCGAGDEKDQDWFISWEDLRKIFQEERDR